MFTIAGSVFSNDFSLHIHTPPTCQLAARFHLYEGWNFNNGNYLFTTDTK